MAIPTDIVGPFVSGRDPVFDALDFKSIVLFFAFHLVKIGDQFGNRLIAGG